ncbi:MAG TPA: HAMP domain-containing sensor histidine kinase [Ohtaekwangia sp.]|uniref:sensor histidine kinase n=1 Tax=Ohtaekwangia sp. TaxID=2066019 RepID=UPI002F934C80
MEKKSGEILGEELTKAKGVIDKFLYSCSHSMRAPLKSITGLVNLLQHQQADASYEPQQHLDLIRKTVSKMESLLNDLERFLANSRKELIIEPVSMTMIVEDVLLRYAQEAEEKGIRFSKNITQHTVLYTDLERLNLVMLQLIINALVFNDASKADKYIDVTVRVNDTGCHIKVLDNGIGMSQEVQQNIFQLFYRGSQQSRGTGIGLYIVSEVLRKMGGSITVNSEEGYGTSFFVWIPNLKA